MMSIIARLGAGCQLEVTGTRDGVERLITIAAPARAGSVNRSILCLPRCSKPQDVHGVSALLPNLLLASATGSTCITSDIASSRREVRECRAALFLTTDTLTTSQAVAAAQAMQPVAPKQVIKMGNQISAAET